MIDFISVSAASFRGDKFGTLGVGKVAAAAAATTNGGAVARRRRRKCQYLMSANPHCLQPARGSRHFIVCRVGGRPANSIDQLPTGC